MPNNCLCSGKHEHLEVTATLTMLDMLTSQPVDLPQDHASVGVNPKRGMKGLAITGLIAKVWVCLLTDLLVVIG